MTARRWRVKSLRQMEVRTECPAVPPHPPALLKQELIFQPEISLRRTPRPMRLPLLVILCCTLFPTAHAEPQPRWWKGNLHTHSLWSDGNDYPEMIAAWYKEQGYNFLGLSDHNVIADQTRWVSI